jgi:hypothetical protein
MLRLFLAVIIIGIANAQAVNLHSYLVFPTLTQAHTRSAQACTQYVCKPGTREWWSVVALTDGTAAVQIEPSGIYGKTASVGPCAVGCGLTPAEQSALKTAVQMGTLLPNPLIYDPAP